MTAEVVNLVRYPVKSVGREEVQAVNLVAGQTMPWDRTWAVTHEHSKADGTEWARCLNFLRVASSPRLAAIRAELDEASETLTLSHPDQDAISTRPDDDPGALVKWLAPLVAENRAAPTGLAKVPNRGMTDTSFPSVSVANMASHRAVSQKVGSPLSMYRWRSNIWLDGLAPWEELEWVDRELHLGGARLRVVAPIERCLNVQANPETGLRDHDVLGALESWGHQNFSMAAEVIEGGDVALGDKLVVT